MTEGTLKELAAHLSCLLTSVGATLEDIQAARAGGKSVESITRGVAYRTLMTDFIAANSFLRKMAEEPSIDREMRGRALNAATLFPTEVGLPDRRAGR